MSPVRIAIFAKAPVPGRAKTRLMPVLGALGAAELARDMLLHALREARAARTGPIELSVAPGPDDPAWAILRNARGVDWSTQPDGDLGARMALVAQRSLAAREPVLLIGTDCPALDAAHLRRAAALLADSDAVMYPAMDGGFVLLGLRRFDASVFDGVPWSTAQTAAIVRDRMRQLHWSLGLGPALRDIDVPEDLAYLPDGWFGHASSSSRGRTRR